MQSERPDTSADPFAAAWTAYAGLAMGTLALFGPLELREGMLPIGGMQVSAIELVAVLALVVGSTAVALRWRHADGAAIRALLTSPVSLALIAWAAVHLASAAWATEARTEAFKFGLRVAVSAGLALIAALLADVPVFRRRLIGGLLAGLSVISAIAIAERATGQDFEPFLALFRKAPTWMLGEQRLATVFSHANTCAAYFELTVPFLAVALARSGVARRWRVLGVIWLIALSVLLSLTYSRAGLAAGALATAILAGAALRHRHRRMLFGIAALHAAAVLTAYFGNPDMRARFGMELRSYKVRYVFDGPCLGHAGETIKIPLTLQNVGQWPIANRQAPASLSFEFWPEEGKPTSGRQWLPLAKVIAGRSARLWVPARLPETPGSFTAVFDIRRHEVIWLSAVGNQLGRLRCISVPRGEALESRASETSLPPRRHVESPGGSQAKRALELDRKHYWQAALALFAERPVLGHGADRFRMAYRSKVPGRAWDRRARSHSIILETAANLGLVGLIVLGLLGGVCLASVAQILIAAGTVPIAGLAASVAILGFGLHSMVDYFMGYTQIYVLAWPIVGLALGLAPGWRKHSNKRKKDV